MTSPRKGSLLVIFLAVFIDLLGFGMVVPLLPTYAKDFGTDEHGIQIALLMASFSAMQFLFAPVWGRLSDRIGRRPVLLVSIFGSCVFQLGYALSSSFGYLMVSRALSGACGANIGAAQAYVADVTDARSRAGAMGVIGVMAPGIPGAGIIGAGCARM